jgi:glycosyltransferase involved in cell wall biosynthesis/GT2 family glycosyltransferase
MTGGPTTRTGTHAGMHIGFVEPHLGRFGGIRRMLEFANRLVARGHTVTFYVPEGIPLECRWMRCDAAIAALPGGFDDTLDVVVFNHEPQWHLLERFERARRKVFYALHYGALYGKEGSWESVRAAVDLQLANSNWTADRIAQETGHRPVVQLGGVNRDVFRPHGGRKRYDLLCTGELQRPWKGTDTILEAGRIAGVKVERYAPKDLDQPALGREYDAARVFAVGSWFEGFGQPGLEALACGVPLVTTDNGGCGEYARDGETALVVPPRDATAMAAAVRRLLDDRELAARLARQGLDVVAEEFDWERRTDELAERLDGVVAGRAAAPPPPRPEPPDDPVLTVVVPAWEGLVLTQHFVESVRRHTDVPYELVVVDNGSSWEAANYARCAADRAVLNHENLGFAKAMNQGLALARGRFVAFCNNDTVLPPMWARRLLETASGHERAAIVVPAVTEARNAATVRSAPGDDVVVVDPFSAPPSAVVYVARTDVIRSLGEWSEEYELASGEDVDLCFTVWTNDLDVVFDERVLVEHVGKGSASQLDDWQGLWARNRRRFLDKWAGDAEVPRLAHCDPERFERNRATARAAAGWMQRYFRARDEIDRRDRRFFAAQGALRRAGREWPRVVWRRAHPHLPPRLVDAIRRVIARSARRR